MNIAFISHSNFLGNSAMHVFSVVEELQLLGHCCVVLVPDSSESVHAHRVPSFPVLLYDQALAADGLPFADAGRLDLIHAWSPREHVRRISLALSEKTGAPYIVHMEDNEEAIVANETTGLSYPAIEALPSSVVAELLSVYRSHPGVYRGFLSGAVGYTCLIDTLLDFAPIGLPTCVFWPSFDPEFADIGPRNDRCRAEHGIADDELVIVYSGNVHGSNVEDVETLYIATLLAHRRGVRIRLVRTGWDYADLAIARDVEMSQVLIQLGFVPRADLPGLLSMADILVQPGKADAFNDYRFPSKLPEYLVSGRPVILPDSNIGLCLADGDNAIKLYDGTPDEIAAAIESLAFDPDRRERIGANGRAFALDRLSWVKTAATLDAFYRTLPVDPPSHAPATAVDRSGSFPVQLIAFYLPQFHPIPENDSWWGKGFTEWANVVRAPRAFVDHDQPRLPTELGFYDLRVVETMHQQAALAQDHGVAAFCFYYYWFNGRRVLEKPLDLWLEKGPAFPFAICWANENWSRRWDGSDDELLIENRSSPEDDERFILDILPILKDPRYLTLDGAPLLHVYKITDLVDPITTQKTWRRVAAAHGIPRLHLSIIQSFNIGDPRPYGFDSAVEFSPRHTDRALVDRTKVAGMDPDFTGYLEDYIALALRSIHAPQVDYTRFRGCFPRWDNTARRGMAGHVFINESPKAYAHWLRFLVREALARADQQPPLVYINAWNEWAEGAYLEPDQRYGRAYLEATRAALRQGVIDHVVGLDIARERAFTEAVSRLPTSMVT